VGDYVQENGELAPISFHFEIIVDSDEVQDKTGELECHVQREARVRCAHARTIYQVGSEGGSEGCPKKIDTDSNPTIEIVGHSRNSDVMIDAIQRFCFESIFRPISPDRN
jgi:hypothetical protein